jgi:hypothetical protein
LVALTDLVKPLALQGDGSAGLFEIWMVAMMPQSAKNGLAAQLPPRKRPGQAANMSGWTEP